MNRTKNTMVCTERRKKNGRNIFTNLRVNMRISVLLLVAFFNKQNTLDERTRTQTHTPLRTHLLAFEFAKIRSHPLNMKQIFINFQMVCIVSHALCDFFFQHVRCFVRPHARRALAHLYIHVF